MTTFFDLGEDIIVSNLCRYLSPLDIFNLALTCKQLNTYLSSNDAFHVLFLHKFGKLTPLNLKEYNWEYLFKKRCDKALNFYTWGSGSQGRLGYLSRDIPKEHLSELFFGVHTPTKVPNFDSTIIEQIHAGGYSFQVLAGGEIYCTGSGYGGNHSLSSPGPLDYDYRPPLRIGRIMGFPPLPSNQLQSNSPDSEPSIFHRRRADNPNLRLPPEQLSFPPDITRHVIDESSFITRMSLPISWYNKKRHVVSISSGRTHFLALDDEGCIFTWDSGNSDWKVGVQLVFQGLQGRIKSISAGWNLNSCYMSGVGIIVWYSRDSITQENFEAGISIVKAHYVVIPELSSIVDYITLQSCVIYINEEGDILRYTIDPLAMRTMQDNSNDTINHSRMNCFNNWLGKYNKRHKSEASFTKLSGCYQSFAVFTNREQVLLGKLKSVAENDSCEPIVKEDLQNKGVIQVAIGDYHYLALTDKGNLWSWGLESQNSGCLGLGSFARDQVDRNRNHIVSEPREIRNPASGKWLAVCTSGWHAGGLFIASEV